MGPFVAVFCCLSRSAGVFDFLEMEDGDRDKITKFSKAQMSNVAKVCNAYPNIEVNYEVEDEDEIAGAQPRPPNPPARPPARLLAAGSYDSSKRRPPAR